MPVFCLMDDCIQISKINDFFYSPRSLYLHSVYESFDREVYHGEVQKKGLLNHSAIEEGRYSSRKNIFQGMTVFCEKYNLVGKIDLYDTKTRKLTERKTKIKKIYDGHRYQLYAQMFALEEMGHKVNTMEIHSLEDNRKFEICKPNKDELRKFENLLKQIRLHNPENDDARSFYCDLSIYKYLSY